MPEEFGTVNLKQGAQTREIELLRRHYRAHRDALSRMIGDAPTEHLAAEYQRLIADIDTAVRKLDELEGKAPAPAAAMTDTNPMLKTTGAGTRPLVRSDEPPMAPTSYIPPAATGAQSRVIMIVIAGIVVLVIIGWLIWRASSERKSNATVVEQQPVTTAPPPAVTPAPTPAPVAPVLKVAPAVADYGTIRKGTRAVRQFQVTNLSNAPIEITVARSACRCLYYDYNSKLPPKGQETITVTVDGARAKAGPLQEQIQIRGKNNPTINGAMTVQAAIR
jgi:Protein of unknown function (DUF1573)